MAGKNATRVTRPVAVRLPHALADLWAVTAATMRTLDGTTEQEMVALALELIHSEMQKRWGQVWMDNIHNLSTVVYSERKGCLHAEGRSSGTIDP